MQDTAGEKGRAHKRCTSMDTHMTEQKQDDQLEHTYSSSVRIRDVALKTCQRRWTIGRSGKRESGKSVLAVRHDDDDDSLPNSLAFPQKSVWQLVYTRYPVWLKSCCALDSPGSSWHPIPLVFFSRSWRLLRVFQQRFLSPPSSCFITFFSSPVRSKYLFSFLPSSFFTL